MIRTEAVPRCYYCCSCPQSMCVHPRQRCVYCQDREDGGPVDREELENLRKCIVVGFYENEYPEYSNDWTSELQTPVTADELNCVINVLRARDAEIKTYKKGAVPCQRCGGDAPEYVIPDDAWNTIVRNDGPEGPDEYICLACFARTAAERIRRLKTRADDIFERLRDRLVAYREKDI